LNGTKLFNRTDPATFEVEGVQMEDLDLSAAINAITTGNYGTISDADLDAAYNATSGLKTQADADASTLGFASDYLANMATNIESAHGRIMDVDIAEETINLSKLNMQQEAALAAIVQANVAMTAVLDLLIKPKD